MGEVYKEEVRMGAIELRPSYWANVSGGKDSLFMLRLILAHPERYPLDGVIHFELEIDYPFIKDVINYMEAECKNNGVRFVRIKPRLSWYDLYKKYGMASRRARWCNNPYKMDSKRQLEEFMYTQGCYVVSYIGYCADEGKRYSNRQSKTRKEVYPLVDFGVEEDSIWQWAKTQPIFNEYYKVNKRCGCMFCPMSDRLQLAYLLAYYPDKYCEFIQMCKDTEKALEKKSGKKHSVFNGNPKYDSEYVDNNVRTKWLPIFKERMTNYGTV